MLSVERSEVHGRKLLTDDENLFVAVSFPPIDATQGTFSGKSRHQSVPSRRDEYVITPLSRGVLVAMESRVSSQFPRLEEEHSLNRNVKGAKSNIAEMQGQITYKERNYRKRGTQKSICRSIAFQQRTIIRLFIDVFFSPFPDFETRDRWITERLYHFGKGDNGTCLG